MSDEVERDWLKELLKAPESFNEMCKRLEEAPEWMRGSRIVSSISFNDISVKEEEREGNPLHGKSFRLQVSNRSFDSDE